MNPKVLAAACLVLGLGIGAVIGRGTVDAPAPGYLAALEADNERLLGELQELQASDGPGLGTDCAAPDPADHALMALRKGTLSTEETIEALEEISAEQARFLNLDEVLGPILEKEGYKAIKVLPRLKPSPSTIAALDQRVIKGAATGSTTQAVLAHYLRNTGRFEWADVKPLVEQGLEQSTRETRGVFFLTALDLKEPPTDEWIQSVQRNYKFSNPVRVALRKRGL